MGKRGQMAMWMLTKFAMLFFIFALFSIILVFEQRERGNVCKLQAQRIADSIANRLNQIIDSPVEDEQRSYVFEPSLNVGRDDDARYGVNVTYRHYKDDNKQSLIVEVLSPGISDCYGVARTDFKGKDVRLHSFVRNNIIVDKAAYNETILPLSPSDKVPLDKTVYMIAIKCGSKTSYPPDKFLFIEDCMHNDPDQCLNFDTPPVNEEETCGFRPS
ncbi:MAG: hypothetical protein ABIG96_00865 [Candidatus Micrarchaeota archaeon]